ncbi:nucleoside 2-deoxyribosyltransferase domain-containing protein [Kitasatospora cathayae]|uniref:Nucleoside 2-deoxyribosyltransferase domain-containing protein n=1 Tax=Kitasatospora cathayae TaxID=3004092 RepID=A0ABY7QI52_9ACTN|nr:nucleoside 2-deoxyribosyltransferase domain-containing protein [Kitasatospora sp. HUAS 3-15]WBP92171.1 nucleoside 2-deoxyribosyltransferase domain-containing protein [Kitasatospora sp. HUAS 3-15]
MTNRYFEAPDDYEPAPGDPLSVFLGGGITGCPDWQAPAAEELLDVGLIVFNPRRRSFPIDNPDEAPRQIAWEHRHLHLAGVTLFWFPADQVQPIALFELGAALGEGRHIAVGAAPGYPRRLDVEHQVALTGNTRTVHASLSDVLDEVIAHAARAAMVPLAPPPAERG